jgi:Tfp pilus assembly PilM family ATPase
MRKRRGIPDALLQLALKPRAAAKSLSRVMPGASAQGFTVLSLDGRWLKVLQVEGTPRARRITRLFASAVGTTAADDVDRIFKEGCASEGIVPHDLLIAHPTHLCTLRLFSLPATDPKEIRDIVELQAEKHTPYAKDEVLIDFKVLDRKRSGYSRVLLVIAHQDVVHRPVRLVEASGLTLDRVGCELEGLVGWFQLVRKGAGAAVSMVIDVDGSTTTVVVIRQGQPQFHRSLSLGSEQLESEGEPAGQRLVVELQRSMEAIEAEDSALKVQDVVLTGCTTRLGNAKLLIERGLDLPVSLIPPWEGREVAPQALTASERVPQVSFTGLVGLALAPSELDLTPQTTRLRQAFEARAKSLVLLACQGIGVLILVSLLIMGRAQREQRYYDTLDRMHRQSAAQAAEVEEALQQLEFGKARIRRRGQLLEAVAALADLSPDGIAWESLVFSHGEELILRGASETLPRIYEFVAALEGLPFFEVVEAKRVSKRKAGTGARDITEFEVACTFASANAPATEAAP